MRILKLVAIVLGIVGLIVAGVYLGRIFLDLQTIMGAANTGRSANVLSSPMATVGLVAGLSALGGLLLGIGLGLPMRTPGAVRRQALQDASDVREASIRRRVGGLDEQGPRSGASTDASAVNKADEELR